MLERWVDEDGGGGAAIGFSPFTPAYSVWVDEDGGGGAAIGFSPFTPAYSVIKRWVGGLLEKTRLRTRAEESSYLAVVGVK
ncbi:hypothetical protein QE152_g4398 [Popillia japonica]|uniref:Uncharacterized protein n=1 Tax=Popillia japonica TaxID=7064 RepID=A0AAW1N0J0_POPJA